MTNEALTSHINTRYETAVVDAAGQFLNWEIDPLAWPEVMQHLRFEPDLLFDFMFCLPAWIGKHILPWFTICAAQSMATKWW